MFGFLADVRNYSCCPPLSEPKGLPDDSEWLNQPDKYEEGTNRENIMYWGHHSYSYLTLRELVEFDYDQTFEDRRYTEQVKPNVWNGAAISEEGKGNIITYREHLGDRFFKHLEELKQLGEPDNVRVVFWFDN